MTEETSFLSYLLSGSTVLLLLAAFYIGRALWMVRREWPQCATDTKILYLLVAPVLTLAVDVLEVTDRLFWSRNRDKPATRAKTASAAPSYRRDSALRSNDPVMRSNG